ncbi:MAG: family 43 glycosylhydrolase, partial [Tannerella sp.]|nr:family 43 glycosylhydrolase [Tannerella sp.]
MKKSFLLLFTVSLLALPFVSSGQEEGRIRMHDPVMIKHKDKVYIFATGRGVTVWSSTDMKSWTREKSVFETTPQWAVDAMAQYAAKDTSMRPFRGDFWAPDISFHNGLYHLYYSASAFGKNTSCIGYATNKTLDPNDPDFKWVDHGPAVCSTPIKDNWNAIDPNLQYGEDGFPYLIWGSFWDGLQIVRL